MRDTITIRDMIEKEMPHRFIGFIADNFKNGYSYQFDTIYLYNWCMGEYSKIFSLPFFIGKWLIDNNYKTKEDEPETFTEEEKEHLRYGLECCEESTYSEGRMKQIEQLRIKLKLK